jgi:rhodanese-related sulfurtransferase
MPTPVTRTPAATSSVALKHFEQLLEFETDCWDVNFAVSNNRRDFTLIDVRSNEMFKRGHLPEAINVPHKEIGEEVLAGVPKDQLIVVYCAGPHCNGTEKGAIAVANLGRPVKKMIGGVTGWVDEGFELVSGIE